MTAIEKDKLLLCGAPSRRDHLTLTTDEGKIDLTEKQLDLVSGGAALVAASPELMLALG